MKSVTKAVTAARINLSKSEAGLESSQRAKAKNAKLSKQQQSSSLGSDSITSPTASIQFVLPSKFNFQRGTPTTIGLGFRDAI